MLRTRTCRRCAAAIRSTAAPEITAVAASTSQESHSFKNDTQAAPLLLSLFVFPAIGPKPAFNEKRLPFLKVLADEFSLLTKSIDVDESDFLLHLARLVFPFAI